MIWNGCLPMCTRLEPDLVAPSGLTVERETKRFKLPHDLSISESGKAAHQAATTIV
jgi:hypothetical protein